MLRIIRKEDGPHLTLHGSVLVDGKGNDLYLMAVPMELSVTPPEEMEHITYELLDAIAVPDEPIQGLLRNLSPSCILERWPPS